jgi:hypothetical protein
MILKEVDGMALLNWFGLAEHRDNWLAVVKNVMDLQVS